MFINLHIFQTAERVGEAEHRAGELSTAVKELQRLLKEASDHSGDLETRLAQQESDAQAELEAKQEAINALKEELRHANILLEAVKQGAFCGIDRKFKLPIFAEPFLILHILQSRPKLQSAGCLQWLLQPANFSSLD